MKKRKIEREKNVVDVGVVTDKNQNNKHDIHT